MIHLLTNSQICALAAAATISLVFLGLYTPWKKHLQTSSQFLLQPSVICALNWILETKNLRLQDTYVGFAKVTWWVADLGLEYRYSNYTPCHLLYVPLESPSSSLGNKHSGGQIIWLWNKTFEIFACDSIYIIYIPLFFQKRFEMLAINTLRSKHRREKCR